MDAMNFVCLANIYKKKECIIDGQKQIYYKKLEPCCGFYYNFNTNGKAFVVLTGKLAGKVIFPDSAFHMIDDVKTFSELSSQNNWTFDLNDFKNLSLYHDHIGEYFTYDLNKNSLLRITNQELLQKIYGATKDYDDKILNNNTDISQMYSTIKKTIISQDEQIMQILTALFKNQRVINLTLGIDMIAKLKENIIVYGSTGTGKTEILKRIANIYEIPIVIEDATSLSETGYVGRNITDMLENLYLAARKDIEKAQKGILVIDEFDKLAEKDKYSKDHVSRIGVQRSLLKLLDGSTFYFGDKKFDTSKLSVVALGAFTGIVDNDDYSRYQQLTL